MALTQSIQQFNRAEPRGQSSQKKAGENYQAAIGSDAENRKYRAYCEQILGMSYARRERYYKRQTRADVEPFLLAPPPFCRGNPNTALRFTT